MKFNSSNGNGSIGRYDNFIGTLVGSAETLGLDQYLPATRGQLFEYVGIQQLLIEEDAARWRRDYRDWQREKDLRILRPHWMILF